MQSIKIGWHVRAFAMGRNNESEGKKSRNRISKEERKKMTLSFIKKYQKMNGGSFPSLNLTQKEVGGSFYTTREIVREIIQENKILGSGDLFPINNNDHSSVEMPLGTVLHFDFKKSSNDEALSKDEDSRYNVEVHALNNVASVEIPILMEVTGSEVITVGEESSDFVSSSFEIENLRVDVEENVDPLDAVSVQTVVNEDSDEEMVSISRKNFQSEVEEEVAQKVPSSENMLSLDAISSEASSSMIISEDCNDVVVSNSHNTDNLQVEVDEKISQMARSSENLPSMDAVSSRVGSSVMGSDDSDEKVVANARNLENLLLEVEEKAFQEVPTSENVPSVDALSPEVSSSMEGAAIANATSEESGKGKLDRINMLVGRLYAVKCCYKIVSFCSKTWEGSSRREIHPALAAFKSAVDAIVKFFTT